MSTPTSAHASGEGSILIVDDHVPNLIALEAILAPLDRRVVRATSGAEALERAAEETFAVILLDVQMPRLDGFETAARLHDIERAAGTPIIFLTAGDTSAEGIRNAYARGAVVDYLSKPFEAEIIRAKVAVFVELHSRGERLKRQAMLEASSEALRRSEQRLRFLADASKILGASLDTAVTLKAIAALAVPQLADWCAVELVGSTGEGEQLAVEHVDPAKVQLAWDIRRRFPPKHDAPNGVPNVLRTGKSELYAEVTDEMLVQGAIDEEHLRITRELGLKSALIVPMIASGTTLGAIILVSAESGRRFGTDDLALAEELASRAALATENARLYQDAREAVRVREDFLSVAGHELNTPLTSVRLQLDALTRAARREGSSLVERAEKKVAADIADFETTIAEQDAELKKARKLELGLRQAQRKLDDDREALDLEVARRLDKERRKVAEDATRRVNEQHRLELAEKDLHVKQMQKEIKELQESSEQTRAGLRGGAGVVLDVDGLHRYSPARRGHGRVVPGQPGTRPSHHRPVAPSFSAGAGADLLRGLRGADGTRRIGRGHGGGVRDRDGEDRW